jgi:tyrosyl-tRNA synthetase
MFVAAKLAASNSEVGRKLNERAVRIDGAVVEDRERVLAVGGEHLLQIGKRSFARVRLVAV